ncbi:hypothetical protein OB03_07955 [Brevundimonas sp. GN22]|uniref:hypothetical protein n=1 Tax=Brevundimonas pishanensis TaxID=2896315 RepID=UPI001FA7AF83|nr:hypothetical protein [Brevundimonas pishanensis]
MTRALLAALACVGLSGCVIIADGEGSSVKVSRGAPMGPYVRSVSADGQKLHATIITNCTQRADFEVVVRDVSDVAQVTISQHKDARCEGPLGDVPIYWSYQVLELPAGKQVRVMNPLSL